MSKTISMVSSWILTCTYFSADSGNLRLTHDIEGHNIRKATSLHVFHHDPEVTFVQVAVDEVDNVLMLAVFHDDNFVDDEILFGLLFQVHLLNGNTSPRGHLICGEHSS